MLIRSQNKEVLAVFENLLDVEVSGGVINSKKKIMDGIACSENIPPKQKP